VQTFCIAPQVKVPWQDWACTGELAKDNNFNKMAEDSAWASDKTANESGSCFRYRLTKSPGFMLLSLKDLAEQRYRL